MLLERSNAILNLSDPTIALGPRKCRPTERLLENRDPLAYKKKRKDPSTDVTASNAHADDGNHTSSSMLPLTLLTHPTPNPIQATSVTESDDDRSSGKAPAIVVEDSDEGESDDGSDEGASTKEDDESELGMCSMALLNFWAPTNRLVNQINSERSGTHRSMCSLSPSHWLGMSKSGSPMSLNVQ